METSVEKSLLIRMELVGSLLDLRFRGLMTPQQKVGQCIKGLFLSRKDHAFMLREAVMDKGLSSLQSFKAFHCKKKPIVDGDFEDKEDMQCAYGLFLSMGTEIKGRWSSVDKGHQSPFALVS